MDAWFWSEVWPKIDNALYITNKWIFAAIVVLVLVMAILSIAKEAERNDL
jgi:hypothetical protein